MLIDQTQVIEERKQRNWTQQHLADACGVSLRTIQRVERDGQASSETVQALNAVFAIELTQRGADTPAPQNIEIKEDKPVWLQALPLMIALVTGIFLGALLAVMLMAQ